MLACSSELLFVWLLVTWYAIVFTRATDVHQQVWRPDPKLMFLQTLARCSGTPHRRNLCEIPLQRGSSWYEALVYTFRELYLRNLQFSIGNIGCIADTERSSCVQKQVPTLSQS